MNLTDFEHNFTRNCTDENCTTFDVNWGELFNSPENIKKWVAGMEGIQINYHIRLEIDHNVDVPRSYDWTI